MVIGLPSARANMRSRLSASGLDSAPAGIGSTPAPKPVPPVCGVVIGTDRADHGAHRTLARGEARPGPANRTRKTIARTVLRRAHIVADEGDLALQAAIGGRRKGRIAREVHHLRGDACLARAATAAQRQDSQRLGIWGDDGGARVLARHPCLHHIGLVRDVLEAVRAQPLHRPIASARLVHRARLPRADLGGDPFDEVPRSAREEMFSWRAELAPWRPPAKPPARDPQPFRLPRLTDSTEES